MRSLKSILNKKQPPAVDPAVLKKLTFRKLSIAASRKIFKDILNNRRPAGGIAVLFDVMFPEKLAVDFLCKSLGADINFFKSMTPSEYEAVLNRCEKVNPWATKKTRKLSRKAKRKIAQMKKRGF